MRDTDPIASGHIGVCVAVIGLAAFASSFSGPQDEAAFQERFAKCNNDLSAAATRKNFKIVAGGELVASTRRDMCKYTNPDKSEFIFEPAN